MKKFYKCFFLLLLIMSFKTNAQPYAYDTLDINNIRAVFNCVGINFSDDYHCFFEAPKGSNNKTISSNILWIGGEDIYGQKYVAGGIGASSGKDFYPGPLSTDGLAYTDAAIMSDWNHVWKVSKQEITYHQNHFDSIGYTMPASIASWPAHGDTTIHQQFYLAPFKDYNNNGIYDPENGDYPLIRGDEALFFIFNDIGGNHYATGSLPWGIEVHAMAYAFDCPNDSALNNAVFINYTIYNRSVKRFTNVNIGEYSDISIGNPDNDFTRCDIRRNSFYTYSATNTDPVFGNFFAAQTTTILCGPYINSDGVDNSKYDSLYLDPHCHGINPANCNEAINGFNFGNCIDDDERYGITGFISFNDTGNIACTEPQNADDYLNYLHLNWKDSKHLRYWDYGYHDSIITNPNCNFMYPDQSDPCYWGTNGDSIVHPPYWSEEQAGNIPNDRQGLACSGTIYFEPGSWTYFDVAFIYGIDYSQPNNINGWTNVLNQRIDSVITYFVRDSTPCNGSFSTINEVQNHSKSNFINVYPNPAMDEIKISIDALSKSNEWLIFDHYGKNVKQGKFNNSKDISINIDDLQAGIYFFLLLQENKKASAKFIKL